jgi:predicted transcriptional regulator
MADVLDSAGIHGQEGATKANLMQRANISHSRLNTFLENMTGSGLINTIIYERSHTYVLTPKGLQFLDEYKKFVEFAEAFGLEM